MRGTWSTLDIQRECEKPQFRNAETSADVLFGFSHRWNYNCVIVHVICALGKRE